MAAAVRAGRGHLGRAWSTRVARTDRGAGRARSTRSPSSSRPSAGRRRGAGTPTDAGGRAACRCSAYPSRSRTTSGWPARRPRTGRVALRGLRPAEDAVPVARLRAAGAVVVGKTNNPEFCYRGYTDNDVFGLTRNPWAPDRTPGRVERRGRGVGRVRRDADRAGHRRRRLDPDPGGVLRRRRAQADASGWCPRCRASGAGRRSRWTGR